jgi:hypothetical protein
MTELPMPIDSLNSILVYLDTERRSLEEANDPKQLDPVFEHAAEVRAWLRSLPFPKGGAIAF